MLQKIDLQTQHHVNGKSCPFHGAQQVTVQSPTTSPSQTLAEAKAYLTLFHQEQQTSIAEYCHRLKAVETAVSATGTYQLTHEELAYGAKVAWRNSNRCIGRLYWKTLKVRDMRHLNSAAEVFQALLEHIQLATNSGDIRSVITIFHAPKPGQPGIRIWNPQLIRYAGYRQPDGSIIGDPMQAELTQILQHMGWAGGPGTPFDLLPLVIQMPGEKPQLFEIPPDLVLEVPFSHPDFPWFADLKIKWHAVPIISNMSLEIGGITHTAAPFNGWYMGTEIGARNLGDEQRYNLLPTIAAKMGLDTSTTSTLWRDRALVELNVATLHSFSKQGVKVIDHHTASDYFILHKEQEERAGRMTPAEWEWIVPPISGSATKVFHHKYKNVLLKPNYFYQPDPWS